MRIIIFIIATLILCGCNSRQPIQHQDDPQPDSVSEIVSEEEKKSTITFTQDVYNKTCSASDLLKLTDKTLQADFFYKLDSVRAVQYPNNDHEKEIMVDLTPKLLDQFLEDIDTNELMRKSKYQKEYHFNIAPGGYTAPEICKDVISISFDMDNCYFMLKMYNTFLVPPDWCTESMVIYIFNIEGDRISEFRRTEAG